MPHLPDTNHPNHDLELVAAYAAGDATGPELERATALVSTCADCAALHHDLRAIAAALPDLPAPVRPRDFRLTPDQAASLRPSGLRGLLATLSGPRFSFATPLGTGLAALGIVGILVASGGLPSSGGAAAPPEPQVAVASPLDRENAAAGAALASPAAVSEAPVVVPEASAAASSGPTEPLAASPAASAAGESLDAPASRDVDTAAGGDTAGGDTAGGASASEPAASDGSEMYLTADASTGPSRTSTDGQPPVGSSPSAYITAGPIESTSTEAGPPWAAIAALLAVAGIVLLALRWGARRLA